MSIISIEEFPEFVEAYPEMEQFYDFDNLIHLEEFIGDTCAD